MEKLKEILLLIFTILFVMGLGASAMHQYEILSHKSKPKHDYIYIFVPQEEHTEEFYEVIIEGYAISP